MPQISTNAIRHFNDRVRSLSGSSRDVTLTAQDAKNLNAEIQNLLARLVELQELTETGRVSVEISANKF